MSTILFSYFFNFVFQTSKVVTHIAHDFFCLFFVEFYLFVWFIFEFYEDLPHICFDILEEFSLFIEKLSFEVRDFFFESFVFIFWEIIWEIKSYPNQEDVKNKKQRDKNHNRNLKPPYPEKINFCTCSKNL